MFTFRMALFNIKKKPLATTSFRRKPTVRKSGPTSTYPPSVSFGGNTSRLLALGSAGARTPLYCGTRGFTG